jgi:membrane fusion protein (multidrug efflux system)
MMRNIIYLLVVLFIAACGNQGEDKVAELAKLKKEQAALNSKIADLEKEIGVQNADKVVKNISVYTVEAKEFRNFIEIQGKVDAKEDVQVNPEAAGILTRIPVKIGQQVSKGQVLAQIDDAVLRQNIAQVQTQLDLAVNVFNKQKNLWDQKIGTEIQFLNAKAQKESLERQIATINQQAEMYKVRSPINGTIDQLDWKLGQAVQPGVPGIRVVNSSNLKAKALVSESYAGRIDRGDEVKVILPDANDSLTTQISFASKSIDPISRSFSVEANLPSKKTLRPNMLAILKVVDYTKKDALTIPIKTILKSETGDYVFIVENGKAKKTLIKTGIIYNGEAEIVEGLKFGDLVISLGLNSINEGDAVKY